MVVTVEEEPLAVFLFIQSVSEIPRSCEPRTSSDGRLLERQRRGPCHPGPTAQETPPKSPTGLKARSKTLAGCPEPVSTGFQSFAVDQTVTWAVGPGWHGDGPLALQQTGRGEGGPAFHHAGSETGAPPECARPRAQQRPHRRAPRNLSNHQNSQPFCARGRAHSGNTRQAVFLGSLNLKFPWSFEFGSLSL